MIERAVEARVAIFHQATAIIRIAPPETNHRIKETIVNQTPEVKTSFQLSLPRSGKSLHAHQAIAAALAEAGGVVKILTQGKTTGRAEWKDKVKAEPYYRRFEKRRFA